MHTHTEAHAYTYSSTCIYINKHMYNPQKCIRVHNIIIGTHMHKMHIHKCTEVDKHTCTEAHTHKYRRRDHAHIHKCRSTCTHTDIHEHTYMQSTCTNMNIDRSSKHIRMICKIYLSQLFVFNNISYIIIMVTITLAIMIILIIILLVNYKIMIKLTIVIMIIIVLTKVILIIIKSFQRVFIQTTHRLVYCPSNHSCT